MRSLLCISIIAAALAAQPTSSHAWEAATTHAGLTEQAALHSSLHERLQRALGLEQGLFAALTLPPADAPALFEVLRALNPTHGYVPDSRGRLSALGWLTAGAVVADTPASHAAHHFFDPLTGKGLTDETLRGLSSSLQRRLRQWMSATSLVRRGTPAPAWAVHEDNPMGLAGFLDQYARAVQSRTPAARSRHLAGALLAAGAMLHVLQDMGSPAHVRNDLAAQLEILGRHAADVGSRFERVAALAYGRLGVPAPAQVVTAVSLQAFFTASDLSGLADRTSRRFFSAHTLPRPARVRPGAGAQALASLLARSLVRPHPAPLPQLDLAAARQHDGARLVDDQGTCVARYRLRGEVLSWHLDDECMAEQVAVLLPEVAAYSAGLLDWLFRGSLEVTGTDGAQALTAAGAEFGPGSLEIFWDDESGVRTALGAPMSVPGAASGDPVATLPAPPRQAHALVVLYRGVDRAGEPLVAAGYQALTSSSAPPR